MLDTSNLLGTKGAHFLSSAVLKDNQIKSLPVLRKPKAGGIPPLRTLTMESRMDLTEDIPNSVIKALDKRPSQALRAYGVPNKFIIAPHKIDDLCLVTSYTVSEEKRGIYYKELTVGCERQLFWLILMIYRPNQPYLCIMTSEEDDPSAGILATNIISKYAVLAGEGANNIKWYRSLEYVPNKPMPDVPGVCVIQCRHPVWADTPTRFFHAVENARASMENMFMILIMNENDLSIAPLLLANEPYGVLIKVAIKEDVLTKNKPKSTSLSGVMRRINQHDKTGKSKGRKS